MKKSDIIKIFKKQREFYINGKTRDFAFRINALKKMKTVIESHEKEIINALYEDMKKPETEAFLSEIYFSIMEIDHQIKNLKKYSKSIKVRTPFVLFKGVSYIYPEPYGNTLIISPWNYPFQLLIAPLAGAIAAGNTALLKPSELSPAVAKIITLIIQKTFSEDYIACIDGGIKENQILLSLPFDYIFYTGSTSVGKIVMKAAAENLIPVTLELGGKSPCIVDPTSDLDLSAKRIVKGKFFNAGQTCVAPDYILVHYSVKKHLVKKMQKYIKEFYGENPQESSDYARIINKKHFERIILYLKDGFIYTGGKYDTKELYIAPTILDDVKIKSSVMQDEIFGPVLPIIEYKKSTDVIDFINERPRPLALYLFSKDKKFQRKVISETSSGGICINDTLEHIVSENLPFGGIGQSGMGSYHGKKSFDTFTHYKSVLKKSYFWDLKMKYPPFNEKLLRRLKVFLKMF